MLSFIILYINFSFIINDISNDINNYKYLLNYRDNLKQDINSISLNTDNPDIKLLQFLLKSDIYDYDYEKINNNKQKNNDEYDKNYDLIEENNFELDVDIDHDDIDDDDND